MYSRISGARDGRGSIEYAEGTVHNGDEERNLIVYPINLIPNGRYADQMAPLWKNARRNHRVQTRRIVISFSKNELDPMNYDDVNMAKVIVTEFIKTYYPDRQAVLYFQRDGKGGCLHCHAIVNDISITDHKGCTHTQRHYQYVRSGIDCVASKYIELDYGKASKSKQTRTERVKAEKAAKIMEEHPELQGDELRKVLIANKAYSYKEDMKERIHEAALKSSDEKEFKKILEDKGIEVIKKNSPKYGEHYVYDYKACPIGVKNTKARSYKLGYSYSPDAMKTIWNEKHIQTQKDDANEFVKWMREQGKSCFAFDNTGKLVNTDWGMWEELHQEYMQKKTSKEKNDSDINTAQDASQKPSTPEVEKKSKNNRPLQKNKISKSTLQKERAAVNKLLTNTEEIINRLASEQARKQISSERYSQAKEQMELKQSKQTQKTL